MAGSPRKRARRAGLTSATDLYSRSAAARRDAELAAAVELTEWWRTERARIRADPSLSEEARRRAEKLLLLEFGRRSKRAIAKAKRDSSPTKLLEADARAAVGERRRMERP